MRTTPEVADLVRNFKENGLKFLLRSAANLRDLMGLLKPALTPRIDFDRLTARCARVSRPRTRAGPKVSSE